MLFHGSEDHVFMEKIASFEKRVYNIGLPKVKSLINGVFKLAIVLIESLI